MEIKSPKKGTLADGLIERIFPMFDETAYCQNIMLIDREKRSKTLNEKKQIENIYKNQHIFQRKGRV